MPKDTIISAPTSNGEYNVVTIKNGRWGQNAYVIQHTSSGDMVLVDPGADFETIRAQLESMRGTLRFVLLTHAHFDHVGSARDLVEHYEVPLYMHRGDARLLRRAPLFALSFDRKVITAPDTFVPVEDAAFDWSGAAVRVIPSPGHTAGGVCYLIGDICFTGDTLMKRIVGRTDLPGASTDDLKASINNLLEVVPAETLLFPGHGAPWPVLEARKWWSELHGNPPEYSMEGAF